jgi:hypothetical protein
VGGKGRNSVVSKKECNNLNLTVAEYFWLADPSDWSRWFAVSSPHVYAVLRIGGTAKKKEAKLGHLNLLSRVTYWAPVLILLDDHFFLVALLNSDSNMNEHIPYKILNVGQ